MGFDIKGFEEFVRQCKEIKVKRMQARKELGEAITECQKQSVINGTDKMTMEEINAEIAEYRREKKAAAVSRQS